MNEDIQDLVSKAMRKAWQLGQTYWQQADSESMSQWKKADITQAKFQQLADETRTAIAAQPDLLAALRKLMDAWPEGMACEQNASAAFDDAYAAITKATGA